MHDLSERIKDLGVKYLVAETRDYNGRTDQAKQGKELALMLSVQKVESLFRYGEDDSRWERRNYQGKLDKIIENRSHDQIERANSDRQEIFENIVREVISRMADEAESRASAQDAWRLQKQIDNLKAQLEFGKPAASVTLWDRLNTRVNLPYFVILCLAVVLLGGLVLVGMTATMTVNVEFSVGEIIGSLLVGTGVAAAGVSYATKDRKEKPNDNG
ncbi:MAG: hypothetical protein ABW098_19175 [Candidatus Thiodiazotropha sp.]